MNLGRIDWPAALAELKKRATGPEGRHRYAQASSLAARFSDGFDRGAAQALEAARLEPLNPLHQVRFALHCLRFGQHERALAAIEGLGPVKDLPLARTVRALATLQSGEDRRAANIAKDLAAADPTRIDAAFLQADAQLRPQLKEAETRSQTLPRDASWAVAWTHLLVKRIVARPKEAAKVVRQNLEVRPVLEKGSKHEALVRQAATWALASREELARALADTKPGSRAEQLVLSLYVEQLHEATEGDVLREVAALHRTYENRPAVRRVYVAELTRAAVVEASNERWNAALRFVEVATRLEPHEPAHLQNRAALLTAMADDAQHEAWADLDRLHYRLALSGCLDAETARRIAKPHRMFAEQARLTPTEAAGAKWGVFHVVVEKDETELVVNQKRIDEDPEALRQFIHHRRAELVFRHLALGPSPHRILLEPRDRQTHRARMRGLCLAAESLAVLVPEEGRSLADAIAARVKAFPAGATAYAERTKTDDAHGLALEVEYAGTIADLATIAWKWAVDPKRPDLVDEVIDAIDATVPFLEERAIDELIVRERNGELSNAQLFNAFVRLTLDAHDGRLLIDQAARTKLAGRLGAELLVTLTTRRLDATPALGRPDIERALGILDRARDRDPSYARVEYVAARVSTIGEFYDEARACVARFTSIAGSKDTPFQQGIEEIQRILDEKKKNNAAGNARTGARVAELDEDDSRALSRIDRLEADIEKFPSSVQLYEELARTLCQGGRFGDARSWCTRAIGRCLTRKAQVRARLLEVEVMGLELLAKKHWSAVEVYLAGALGAALPEIEADAFDTPHYALQYLRGSALLAKRDRKGAEQAFRVAHDTCTHQLHRAALKPLADDVDQALLERTRSAIEGALAAGKVKDAWREASTVIAEARAPEACLLDLARVLLAAAVSKDDIAALPTLRAPWAGRLATALADPVVARRARAVAQMAEELHEPSKKEAAVLLRRIDAFSVELAFADTITEATRLERRGDFAQALAMLDSAGERALSDARALRLRAMLLLRLDRFADADATMDKLRASGHPSAKSLVEKWPDLRFKMGLAAVTRKLRDNDLDAAQEILVPLRPTSLEGELEYAYSRAFLTARLARRLLDQGSRTEALEKMEDAIEILETKLATKEGAGHARIKELRDRLDADLGHMKGTDR